MTAVVVKDRTKRRWVMAFMGKVGQRAAQTLRRAATSRARR